MPINRSQQSSTTNGMPVIGKLRKGGPKQGNGFGKDLDYFRFTSNVPGVQQRFTELFGEKPKQLRVVFLQPDVDSVWDEWYKEYASSTMIRRCDGCTINLELKLDPKLGGVMQQVNKPCIKKTIDDALAAGKVPPAGLKMCACSGVGVLYVYLRDFPYMGITMIETHSKHDMLQIGGALRFLAESGVDLREVPFVISRIEREISTPDTRNTNTGRSRRTKSLLHLEPDPEWFEQFMQKRNGTLLSTSKIEEARRMLTVDMETLDDGDDEDVIDASDYEQGGFSQATGKLNGHANGHSNGHANGHVNGNGKSAPVPTVSYSREDYVIDEIIKNNTNITSAPAAMYQWFVDRGLMVDAETTKSRFAEFAKANGYSNGNGMAKEKVQPAITAFMKAILATLALEELEVILNPDALSDAVEDAGEQDAVNDANVTTGAF